MGSVKQLRIKRRRTVREDGPDPIDIHVGRRLREARILAHASQEELGAMIGVSFQAIHKYETGENRLSASRMLRAAKALSTSLTFFFEGVEDDAPASPPAGAFTPSELELIRQYRNITDDQMRAELLLLVKRIGTGQ